MKSLIELNVEQRFIWEEKRRFWSSISVIGGRSGENRENVREMVKYPR